MTYPKTENLFTRDPDTHKLRVGRLRLPEFGQVCRWLVTEKIDGTNIRLQLLPNEHGLYTARIRGRTDSATLPKDFVEEALGYDLNELAGRLYDGLVAINNGVHPAVTEPLALTAYGEGYGPGIQRGGVYAPRKSLRLFDVVTSRAEGDQLWRTWDDVGVVADALGLETAPVLGRDLTAQQVVSVVKGNPISRVARDEGENIAPIEGVIARTDPYLFNYRGQRVAFKLKGRDLPVDEQCSGSGYAHKPHGNCRGYSTDRT